jgi:hypothetical protein
MVIFAVAGAVQFTNGSVIDPMLMGRALRLSSFGIIISLAFWGAVWGIPGMFLSVPIMVGLMIVCSHVPALRPVAILLSREGLPEEDAGLPKPIADAPADETPHHETGDAPSALAPKAQPGPAPAKRQDLAS